MEMRNKRAWRSDRGVCIHESFVLRRSHETEKKVKVAHRVVDGTLNNGIFSR